MKFACPNCGQRIEAESAWGGRQISCPTCANSITVPPAVAGGASSCEPISVEPQINAAPEPNTTPAAVVTAKPRRRRTLACAAAALVLLLGIVLAGRFFFTPKAGAGSSSIGSALLALFDRADVTEVHAFPGEVNLGAKQDRQSVVVQAVYADGATRDVTAAASFSLGNKALTRLENYTLYPIENGKTELQVKFSGKVLRIPVTIDRAKVEQPISFRLDVIPALTKSGCNSGACHVPRAARTAFASPFLGTILTVIITGSRANKWGVASISPCLKKVC